METKNDVVYIEPPLNPFQKIRKLFEFQYINEKGWVKKDSFVQEGINTNENIGAI